MPTAHDTGAQKTDDPSLSRVGTFSDGVFAIAITLLVLAIRIPHPTDADADEGLLTLLTREWRSYLALVLSFMLVAAAARMPPLLLEYHPFTTTPTGGLDMTRPSFQAPVTAALL
jgi:hypothetical protein